MVTAKKSATKAETPTRRSQSKRKKATASSVRDNKRNDAAAAATTTKANIDESSDATREEKSQQQATEHVPLQRILVGGPLLGNRPESISGGNKLIGWDTFEPIITPEIPEEDTGNHGSTHDGGGHNGKSGHQRFILLPHSQYVSVLAYQTGVKVATLVPTMDEIAADLPNIDEKKDSSPTADDDAVLITSVALARYRRKSPETTVPDVLNRIPTEDDANDNHVISIGPNQILEELVLMVGCQDGSLREFSLKDLTGHRRHMTSSSTSSGSYRIQGPIIRPRRVIRIKDNQDAMLHLTVPYLRTMVREDGILIYVALQKEQEHDVVPVEVKRLLVPHFDGSTNVVLSQEEEENQQIRLVDQFNSQVRKSVGGKIDSTLPFKMLSVARLSALDSNTSSGQKCCALFLVLARMDAVSVYFEMLDSAESFDPITFKMPLRNPLTAIDVGLNKSDISCGHYKGNIRVLNNALENVERYHNATSTAKRLGDEGKSFRNPKLPQTETISSRVHWHALPVSSLVYDTMSYPMDPLLYSGGDECVLVTWQIAQGRDRPVDVKPRLALGGIVHVTSSDRCDTNPVNGILVYCDDNTLQLIMSHNKGQVWKIQGLAGVEDEDSNATATVASMEVDPRSSNSKNSSLVISGLLQAPGYIHWFNPSNERLDASLEVAPFNRISRNEPDELPLPTPSVTCHAFSKNGADLITIDEYPTENVFVGSVEEHGNDESYGVVSTIRFWMWNDTLSSSRGSDVSYAQVACMAFPHGPKNRISAIGISRDGKVACTVSFQEKAFRVWQKVPPLSKATQVLEDRQHSWTCRYKVTTPSGFSNHSTPKNGVSFSDDGSILAISFGQFVTLWDVDEARFLTSFSHMFGDYSVESVCFVNPGLHQDLLLVQSKGGVVLRSPHGRYGSTANFSAWTVSAYQHEKDDELISAVTLVESHASVAIAWYSTTIKQSRIDIVDANTGRTLMGKNDEKVWRPMGGINGCVVALCATGQKPKQSNWDNDKTSCRIPELSLYALTSTGHLYRLLTEDISKQIVATSTIGTINGSTALPSTGPRLEMIPQTDGYKKRQRMDEDRYSAELLTTTKKMALEVFAYGSEDGTVQPSTYELPSLSGNFVRAFVGRGLSRKKST
jgi:hypothetical protein